MKIGFLKRWINQMDENNKGFTAAEIITVVAIIAILALIVIPKFWSRTEEARIARAKEEMARMADAEALVFADTGQYVYLGNLHGTEPDTLPAGTAITTWNYQNWVTAGRPAVPQVGSGYTAMTVGLKMWKGPYITYQPTEMFETDFSPLDPWKNPYIFFGPVSISSIDSTISTKIRFWSAGPNLAFDTNVVYLPWGINNQPIGDDILYVR